MLTYIPNFKIYTRAIFTKDDKEYVVKHIDYGSCKEDTFIKIALLDDLYSSIDISEDELLERYKFSGRALPIIRCLW